MSATAGLEPDLEATADYTGLSHLQGNCDQPMETTSPGNAA